MTGQRRTIIGVVLVTVAIWAVAIAAQPGRVASAEGVLCLGLYLAQIIPFVVIGWPER